MNNLCIQLVSLAAKTLFCVLIQMVMKITFAKLMKTYKMTLPEGYKIVAAQRIITQVKDDVPCVLESR